MSGNTDRLGEEFEACFGRLAAIGRDPAGGWTRLAWTDEDRAARASGAVSPVRTRAEAIPAALAMRMSV